MQSTSILWEVLREDGNGMRFHLFFFFACCLFLQMPSDHTNTRLATLPYKEGRLSYTRAQLVNDLPQTHT